MKRPRKTSSPRRSLRGVLTLALLGAAAGGQGADWPQWRGPNRDGVSTETGWHASWGEGGPRVLWRAAVGRGYSSVAVAGGRLFTLGNVKGLVQPSDVVWCFDALTGDVLWKHDYPSQPGAYPGPRMTPTVDGGAVFTLSRHGLLFCLDATNGSVRWQADIRRDYGVKDAPYGWGFAGSPAVLDKWLVLDAGKLVVVDKATGALAFALGDGDDPAFSSPALFQLDGKWYATSFNQSALAVYDLTNRQLAGRHEWKAKYLASAATPIVSGDRLFITSGYGRGCALLRLRPDGLRLEYESASLAGECITGVLDRGSLYSVSGEQGKQGTLKCLDFATGAVRWSFSGFRVGGGVVLAGGVLLHLMDNGELAAAEASPVAYRELARVQALQGPCWSAPVLANGLLYARSNSGELVCLDVRPRPGPKTGE